MPTTISPMPESLLKIFRIYWEEDKKWCDEEFKKQSIGDKMDKKIKDVKASNDKKMDKLVKEDVKRDKACDMKMMKKNKGK